MCQLEKKRNNFNTTTFSNNLHKSNQYLAFNQQGAGSWPSRLPLWAAFALMNLFQKLNWIVTLLPEPILNTKCVWVKLRQLYNYEKSWEDFEAYFPTDETLWFRIFCWFTHLLTEKLANKCGGLFLVPVTFCQFGIWNRVRNVDFSLTLPPTQKTFFMIWGTSES